MTKLSCQQDPFLKKNTQLSWQTAGHPSVWLELPQQQQCNQSPYEKPNSRFWQRRKKQKKKQGMSRILSTRHWSEARSRKPEEQQQEAGEKKRGASISSKRLKDRGDTKRERIATVTIDTGGRWEVEVEKLLQKGASIRTTRWREAKLTRQTGSVGERHQSNSDRDGRQPTI